ncbi:10293_t:CDS:1, partial [Racocetra persica]
IDQIWMNLHITTLDYAYILDTTPTDSDHNITLLEVTLSATPISLYKQPKRKITFWKHATDEQIEKCQNHLDGN